MSSSPPAAATETETKPVRYARPKMRNVAMVTHVDNMSDDDLRTLHEKLTDAFELNSRAGEFFADITATTGKLRKNPARELAVRKWAENGADDPGFLAACDAADAETAKLNAVRHSDDQLLPSLKDYRTLRANDPFFRAVCEYTYGRSL